jgi:radical SAM protein with 4Fe4S-binding SPASM domain
MNMCSLWTMPFIFVDGTVTPCCSLNEQNDRPWQRKTSLGNIFEQDFRKIWYGPKYTAMLDALREGKRPENCSRCAVFEYRPGACRPTQAAAECQPSRSECAPGAQRIL